VGAHELPKRRQGHGAKPEPHGAGQDVADVQRPPPQIEPAEPGISDGSAAKGVRSTLEFVALVAAPTTIVTALAFFFGWTETNARALYFGIDASALGFSTQDYLMRSADALFVPLAALLVLALLVILLDTVVTRDAAGGRRHALRAAALAAVVVGVVLFTIGVAAVFATLPFSPHYLFPSASSGLGVALLAYGLHLLGRLSPSGHWLRGIFPSSRPGLAVVGTLAGLLIVLSAFWTASEYAKALGRGRAKDLAAALDSRPRVAVFAPRRLLIAGPGVTEKKLSARDAAYRYRYAGLRLLVRSDGKYFLLPKDWSTSAGAAIVLPDSAALRFEFRAGQ
jgi:hypothetical protein